MLVKVTNPENQEVFEYYIEDKLYKQLENKVKPSLGKKDEDYVIVIDGEERSGTSLIM